jgi:hypothetical protein
MIKNYLNYISSVALVAAPLCLCFATSASAQTTVFSDDFSDNNRDGWYLFGADAGLSGTPNTAIATTGSLVMTNNDGNYFGTLANFSQVSLVNEGDYIELSLDYTVIEDLGGNVMTIGLHTAIGGAVTTDLDAAPGGTNSGYFSYNRQNDYYMKAADGDTYFDVNGSSETNKIQPSPYFAAGSYTYILNLTKTASGISLTQTTDAGTISETVIADSSVSNINTVFDMVMVRARSSDVSFDNVLITSNIPEPSSYALLAGMFGLTLVMLRRRK